MSPYSVFMVGILASEISVVDHNLRRLPRERVGRFVHVVVRLLVQPRSPSLFLPFQDELHRVLLELRRKIVEFASNRSQPDADTPHDVIYEAGGYRRQNLCGIG